MIQLDDKICLLTHKVLMFSVDIWILLLFLNHNKLFFSC